MRPQHLHCVCEGEQPERDRRHAHDELPEADMPKRILREKPRKSAPSRRGNVPPVRTR